MPKQAETIKAADIQGFDPDRFAKEGPWHVKTLTGPCEVIIEKMRNAAFRLHHRDKDGNITFSQDLYYTPFTKTLESHPDDGKARRAISFWRRLDIGDAIFGMWRASHLAEKDDLLPWEYEDYLKAKADYPERTEHHGSWGAEDG